MPGWDGAVATFDATGPEAVHEIARFGQIAAATLGAIASAAPVLGLAGGIAAASAAALSAAAVVYTGLLGLIAGVMAKDALRR